jgi:DtxR family Mn-dependent transcriptional regulator
MEEFDISTISPTIQDYLSLIYIRARDQEPVVGAQLAELLGVKPPTVTNTLKRMVRDGLITMDENGTHLTDLGWQAAKVVMRRHMLMERMMENTLPWSKLHAEAHHLEHAISTLAENALMEQLGNPTTCPHGNPLPGAEESVAFWQPLTMVNIGEKVTIRRIHELAEENMQLLEFLADKNIKPGNQFEVIEIIPVNNTITLRSKDQQVTLGNALAQFIYVESTSGNAS